MDDVILSVRGAVQAADISVGPRTIDYGLPTLGPGLDIGIIADKTIEGMAHRPEMAGRSRTTMFLGIVSTEAFALIDLVAGFILV